MPAESADAPAALYSPRVRALFREPRHAGDAGGSTDGLTDGSTITASAAEGGAGARIVLTAATDGARLTTFRFRAFGCPHLVAAAESTCERFEGGPVEALDEFSVAGLMRELDVPVEKTGRLLTLEDALTALKEQLEDTARGRA